MKFTNSFIENDVVSKFDDFLEPLNNMITLTYSDLVLPKLNNILRIYGSDIFKHDSAYIEVDEIVKEAMKMVLLNISKKYRRNLLEYYSESGLILFLKVSFNQLCSSYLESSLKEGS